MLEQAKEEGESSFDLSPTGWFLTEELANSWVIRAFAHRCDRLTLIVDADTQEVTGICIE